jgi:5-methylcytosine-specific restriction endonuclease McrA
MANEIISRSEAKAKGLKRYFTGNLCKHGHVAERVTANGCCVTCGKEIDRRWRKANPDKVKEKLKIYWKANPEKKRKKQKKYAARHPEIMKAKRKRWSVLNQDKVRENERRYKKKYPEKVKERLRKWRRKNAERLKIVDGARVAKWRVDNPEKVLINSRKGRHTRRARQYEAGGSYTNAQIQELLERQDWKCIYCSTCLRSKRELDHIMPLARGGSNDISNLQWLCLPCNRKKRDKDPIDFEREIKLTTKGALL